MKITEINTVKNKIKSKKTGASSGVNFASFMSDDEETEVKATQSASPISAISIINEINEVSEDEKRKQTIRHGHEILDELEELRNGLLLGTLNEQALQNAHKKALSNRSKTNDVELEELINEIEVRAAVELAKRGLL